MMHIQLLPVLFFGHAAVLAFVFVAFASGFSLPFPIIPVIRFVSPAPRWVVCSSKTYCSAILATKVSLWIFSAFSKFYIYCLSARRALPFNLFILRFSVTFSRAIFLSFGTVNKYRHWLAALLATSFNSPYSKFAFQTTKLSPSSFYFILLYKKLRSAIFANSFNFHNIPLKAHPFQQPVSLSRRRGLKGVHMKQQNWLTASPRYLDFTTIGGNHGWT